MEVKSKVFETFQKIEPIAFIRQVFRQDLLMRYKQVKRIPFRGNHQRCLVLRQQYSKRYFQYYSEFEYFINLDETFINQTDLRRRRWFKRGCTNSLPLKKVEPRISLFVALSNKGEVYYSISQANTCKETKSLFLTQLAQTLDNERPLWRNDTIITMDNASYNSNDFTINKMKSLGMRVMFQGPYGFDVSPCELYFAQLKSVDMNIDNVPTGLNIHADEKNQRDQTIQSDQIVETHNSQGIFSTNV